MIVVIDTNVLVSGLVHRGKPGKILELALAGLIFNYTSIGILNEFHTVMKRKFLQTDKETDDQIKLVTSFSKIVEPTVRIDIIKEDPKDNMILECAAACNAEVLITGDRHLLNLARYSRTCILSPADFLARYYGKLDS